MFPKGTHMNVSEMWLWVKTNGIPFWGMCTTRFRLTFSWGLGCSLEARDFDPWPCFELNGTQSTSMLLT